MYQELVEQSGMGASMMPQGTVVHFETGETVARISYNGCVWDMAGREIAL